MAKQSQITKEGFEMFHHHIKVFRVGTRFSEKVRRLQVPNPGLISPKPNRASHWTANTAQQLDRSSKVQNEPFDFRKKKPKSSSADFDDFHKSNGSNQIQNRSKRVFFLTDKTAKKISSERQYRNSD